MQPEQKKYQLVAVVVTCNRLDQLQFTVQRLLKFDAAELDAVVVVDNASTDGTGDWLATFDDPRLVVHRHAENGGSAAGFESGMRLAVERFDPDRCRQEAMAPISMDAHVRQLLEVYRAV